MWLLGGDRPRIIFNIFKVFSYCPLFNEKVVSVPVSDWSVLSQSVIGQFCPSLLLVGSAPVSYWSVLSQSLIGRFCPSPWLVGSVPVYDWSVLSQSLIGRICSSLWLVVSVPVSDWSVLSQSLIGRFCPSLLLVGCVSPPLIGRFLPATSWDWRRCPHHQHSLAHCRIHPPPAHYKLD